MPNVFAFAFFMILVFALGTLIVWEFGRRRRGPVLTSEAFQRQLGGGPRIAYDPPPERRKRSLDRKT